VTASTQNRSAGRVPDFFIVGHPKCGTTALYEMLSVHPQVFMPERKEPRWFASDLPSPYQPSPAGEPGESFEDYLALFAPARAEQLVGEGSTAYIWSQTAAALIAEARPDARIVAILREPASFLRSLHLQLLQHKSEEEPSLRRALELEGERREGRSLTEVNRRWPQVLMYSDRVRYVEQLRRFHAVFEPEQVLVLIYDDFRADNEGTVRRVQRFLGIEERGTERVREANPSVRRRVGVDNAIHDAFFGGGPALRTARRVAKLLTPERARRQAFHAVRRRLAFAAPQAADEGLMAELRERFAPQVRELSEYLDRDLVSLWGYGARP
jgi:hypothetical protein